MSRAIRDTQGVKHATLAMLSAKGQAEILALFHVPLVSYVCAIISRTIQYFLYISKKRSL